MATTSKAVAAKPAGGKELSTFLWTGKDKRGTIIKGEIEGRSESLVRADLRRQGLSQVSTRKKPKPLLGGAGRPVKSRDIAFFSRQIATMMHAGVPLVQSLDILATGQKNQRFRKLIETVREDVSQGHAFHEALAKHPVQFDELYTSLVNAGESAGVLDTILSTIATYKERMESIKAKVKKALLYPAMVMFVAFLVSAILLIYVVPQFRETFRSFGADLPGFTLLVIGISDWVTQRSWLIIGGLAGIVTGLVYAKNRVPKVAYTIDRLLLKIPIVGNILHKSALARFARTLAITFRAGVPLVEALDSVAGATGNRVYSNAVRRIQSDVEVGHALNLALRQTNLFPHMVIQMTAIGEEAGALDTMMLKVAEFYEEEVNNAVDTLSSALEPLIMVIIGGLVGSLVVAMYLPIFKLASTI